MRVHTLSEKLRVDDQRAQWRRRGGGALTRRSPLFRVRLVSGAFTSAFAGACPSAARACPPRRYPQKRETRTTRPSRRTNPTSRDGIPRVPVHISPRGPQHPLRVDPRHDYRGSEHGLRSRPSPARPGHRPVLVDRSREGRSRVPARPSRPRGRAREGAMRRARRQTLPSMGPLPHLR